MTMMMMSFHFSSFICGSWLGAKKKLIFEVCPGFSTLSSVRKGNGKKEKRGKANVEQSHTNIALSSFLFSSSSSSKLRHTTIDSTDTWVVQVATLRREPLK